jgi:hypothetical protein
MEAARLSTSAITRTETVLPGMVSSPKTAKTVIVNSEALSFGHDRHGAVVDLLRVNESGREYLPYIGLQLHQGAVCHPLSPLPSRQFFAGRRCGGEQDKLQVKAPLLNDDSTVVAVTYCPETFFAVTITVS